MEKDAYKYDMHILIGLARAYWPINRELHCLD